MTALAPIDVVQNFSVLYRLSAALERDALSTADSAALSQLSVQTYAPSPGVCVDVYDDRTSATADAIAGGGSDPWTWSWTLSVPLETLEGRYGLDVWARDCSSGTVLSARPRVSYVIDNTAPEIDSLSVTPRAGSNTVFTSQPIQVKASDALAGLDVTGSGATLEPTAGGAAIDVAGQVWYEDSTWLVTDAAPLTVGERYRLRLRVVDLAGNAALFEYGFDDDDAAFLAISMTPTSAQATMSQTCSLGPIDPLSQTREAHCPSPTLNVGDSVVDLSGSVHADVAFVDHVVPLDRAELQGTLVGGVSDPQPQPAYPQGTTRTVSMRFAVEDPLPAAATLGVPAATFAQEAVVTAVPATWISAQLTLDAVTSPEVVACSVRESASMPRDCSPDPLHHRYLVTFDDSITDVEAAVADHAGLFETEAKQLYDSPFKGYLAWIPPQQVEHVAAAEEVANLRRDAFEVHRVFSLAHETTISQEDMEVLSLGRVETRRVTDAYGGVLFESRVELPANSSEPSSASSSLPCVQMEDQVPEGAEYVAHSPDPEEFPPGVNDHISLQYLFFLHRVENARWTPELKETRQILMCATGGADADHGWRILLTGPGTAYQGWQAAQFEGTQYHSPAFKLAHKWEKKTLDEGSYKISLPFFKLVAGPLSIGVTVTQTMADRVDGSNKPPRPEIEPKGMEALWRTAANAWWQDKGCGFLVQMLNPFCVNYSGSAHYQGAAVEALWELPTIKRPIYLVQAYYAHWHCAALVCPDFPVFPWSFA